MILSYNQMQTDPEFGQGVFFGKIRESPEETWGSTFPNDVQALAESVRADPSLALKGLTDAELNALRGVTNFSKFVTINGKSLSYFDIFARGLGNTGLYNVVESSRQLIGMMVRTTGMLSPSFRAIKNIFSEEASTAMRIINIAESIVKSEAFAMALDAIGFIPVVGWIIKVVVEVVKSITSIVAKALDANLADARTLAAKQLTVPISTTNFSKDADDAVVRQIFEALRQGQQQRFIEPGYNPISNTGEYMGFTAQGVYDDGAWAHMRDETMGLGWVIQPGDLWGGFGFVPGAGNVTRSLFFPAGVTSAPGSDRKGCAAGAMRDLGSLYQTGQGLLSSWWSMVLKPGPAMFSVNPLAAKGVWENYIYGMLMLGPNVLQGWTCAPTGLPFTDKFRCIEGMMGVNKHKEGVGDCKWTKRGQDLTLPPDFGLGAHAVLMGYLYELYFGLQNLRDRDKNYNPDQGIGLPLLNNPKFYEDHRGQLWVEPDSVDISESIVMESLNNLHDRQEATLQSINCMYVNGDDPDRFPAFKNNKALRNRWAESVTAILGSQDWRRVIPDDVPEGQAKNALRQRIQQAGLNPDTFNPPCPPGAALSHPCRQLPIQGGPSVLGDPTPPVPPPSNDVDVEKFLVPVPAHPVPPGGKKKRSSGGAGAVIAVAAVAAFLAAKK